MSTPFQGYIFLKWFQFHQCLDWQSISQHCTLTSCCMLPSTFSAIRLYFYMIYRFALGHKEHTSQILFTICVDVDITVERMPVCTRCVKWLKQLCKTNRFILFLNLMYFYTVGCILYMFRGQLWSHKCLSIFISIIKTFLIGNYCKRTIFTVSLLVWHVILNNNNNYNNQNNLRIFIL